MYRYVVMIGSEADSGRLRALDALRDALQAAGWSMVMESAGVRVFTQGASATGLHAHVLPDSAGVVLGTLFARRADVFDETPSVPWHITSADTQALLASRGRELVSRGWGNYVALIRGSGQSLWVIKDPSGSLPCWMAADDRATWLCASPADLIDCGLPPFRIQPAYLKCRVLHASTREPPFNGVTPIHRGECVEFNIHTGQIQTRAFYWRPQAFTDSPDALDALDDLDHAARALRAQVRSCTRAWVSSAQSVLHRLSGGLDSSIVAGCLKEAPARPAVCAYTYFNPRGHSDERPWARLAARHAQLEHRLVPVGPDDINLELALTMPRLATPASVLGILLRSTIEQTLAEEKKATLVLNGDGGDSGFGAEAVRYAAAEYVRRCGLTREFFHLASAVALRTDRSAAAVVAEALRARIMGVTPAPISEGLRAISRLVRPEVLDAHRRPEASPHAWFDEDPRIPWATVRRLGMLLAAPEMYDVLPREETPQVIAPLYSQPVVETLLRIPLDRLFEGGRDRGLARRTFAREVPEPILTRLWKDRAPGFHAGVIFQNRRFLREILLDGLLVREALLDPAAIEDALSEEPDKSEVLPGELLRHLDVELWARSWGSR